MRRTCSTARQRALGRRQQVAPGLASARPGSRRTPRRADGCSRARRRPRTAARRPGTPPHRRRQMCRSISSVARRLGLAERRRDVDRERRRADAALGADEREHLARRSAPTVPSSRVIAASSSGADERLGDQLVDARRASPRASAPGRARGDEHAPRRRVLALAAGERGGSALVPRRSSISTSG